jgi:hypothetical protein
MKCVRHYPNLPQSGCEACDEFWHGIKSQKDEARLEWFNGREQHTHPMSVSAASGFDAGYDQGREDALEEAEAALKAKDEEIKLLKSHYRQGYFDLMKAQLDDPIAAAGKVKEIDTEITQALKDLRGEK